MWTQKGSSKGGMTSAKKQREGALNKYYKNPNICLYCKKIITVKDGAKIRTAKKKKFCNFSCYGKWKTGKGGIPSENKKLEKTFKCKKCNGDIVVKREKADKYFKPRTVCDECKRKKLVDNRTKKDIFSSYQGWTPARNVIRAHAKKTYMTSEQKQTCKKCGYDRYVEVCHIRPVSDFPDLALVSEINDISNLVALCPTHHWEYDNGFLKLQ